MTKKEIREEIEKEIFSQTHESGLTREEVLEPTFLTFIHYYLDEKINRFDLQKIAIELGFEVDFTNLKFAKKLKNDKTTNNLRSLRLSRGLTQEQLGKLLHVTNAGICFMEKKGMSAKVARKCAQVLGVSPLAILGADNFRIKPSSEEERNRLIEILNGMVFDQKNPAKER